MRFNLKCLHCQLTDEQKSYTEEKIAKATKFAQRAQDESAIIEAAVSEQSTKSEDQRFKAEITIQIPHAIIRAEKQAATVQAAVDEASEKIGRQISRYKERQHHRSNVGEWLDTPPEDEDEMKAESAPGIIKRKRFSNSKPMTEDEAIELMELSGHDFFMFNNVATQRFSVVYRRKDGNYGLLEPKVGAEQ